MYYMYFRVRDDSDAIETCIRTGQNEHLVQEELNARNQELKSNRAKGLKGAVNSYKNSVTKFYDTIVKFNGTLLRIRS